LNQTPSFASPRLRSKARASSGTPAGALFAARVFPSSASRRLDSQKTRTGSSARAIGLGEALDARKTREGLRDDGTLSALFVCVDVRAARLGRVSPSRIFLTRLRRDGVERVQTLLKRGDAGAHTRGLEPPCAKTLARVQSLLERGGGAVELGAHSLEGRDVGRGRDGGERGVAGAPDRDDAHVSCLLLQRVPGTVGARGGARRSRDTRDPPTSEE
jgi:hypothetical protein